MKTFLNLIQANSEINRLNADIESVNKRVEELELQNTKAAEEHAAAMDSLKAEHKTALDEANGKIQLLTEANQNLEEQQESASEQAAQVLSKVGVSEPIEENTETVAQDAMTLDQHWEAYSAIRSGKEKRAYYNEHIRTLKNQNN